MARKLSYQASHDALTGLINRREFEARIDQALEDAWALMQRLLGSARDTVVSWARVRDDSELTPSPLLERIDATDYEGPGDPGWTIRNAAGAAPMETVRDDTAPAVEPDEQVRGGAYTVQKQYVEPFRAFAEGRLGIRRPDPFNCGLSPGQRGDIVHNALHNLVHSQNARPYPHFVHFLSFYLLIKEKGISADNYDEWKRGFTYYLKSKNIYEKEKYRMVFLL